MEKSFYDGKTIVFTGRLDTMRRVEAAKLVNNSGGTVAGVVTAKTDIVVIGSNVGEGKKLTRKYVMAKGLQATGREIGILTEDEFLMLFI